MARAIAIYTGGIHGLIQAAVREDGAVFKRFQNRTIYGLRWTAWESTGEVLGHNQLAMTDEMPAGFSTLRRATVNDCFINNRALFNAKGEVRARLPN